MIREITLRPGLVIRLTRWRDETRIDELLAVPISSGRLDIVDLAASGPRQAIEWCRSKETCMSWMQHRQKDDSRLGPFWLGDEATSRDCQSPPWTSA
jgi:hypothetical protein